MRLIRGLHNLSVLKDGCVATIGNFDGVHLGHRVILSQVQERALALGVPSVAMVFEPQPREFFQPESAPPRLMRFREKLEAIRAQGIDIIVCLQFNDRLRSLTADAFIKQILVDALRVKHVVVGDDFRFGCDRAGNFERLRSQGLIDGFSVENTRTIEVDGDRVSSSRIRQALNGNNFALASRLLGRSYLITGCVIHGRKLGRQIGVPTANVSLGRKVPALNGVYAVTARLADEHQRGTKTDREFSSMQDANQCANSDSVVDCWQGVANIGIRPTVDGVKPALEVHLFDFAGDLYGHHLQVTFHHKIRDEKKFDSIEQLKENIQKDLLLARQFFTETA